MADVARIPGEARAIAEAHSTTLRFAATHALSFTFMPDWLRSLEAHTSMGPIRLLSDVQETCEALLLQSQVQLVLSHAHELVPGPLQAGGYPSVRVGSDELIPVSAPDEAGAPAHRLDIKGKGASVQLLGYSTESGLARILKQVRGTAMERLHTHTVFTAHLASVLRTMALSGRGVAWLPATLIREDLAGGRLVAAAPDDWRIALDIRLYRDRAAIGAAGEDFWTAVKQKDAAP